MKRFYVLTSFFFCYNIICHKTNDLKQKYLIWCNIAMIFFFWKLTVHSRYFFSFAHHESINRWNHFKSLETTSNIYGKKTKLAKDNYEIEVIDQYSREALLFFRAVREYQNISFHTHTPYYALRNCYSLWNMNTILSMLSFWFMGSYSTWKLVWKCLSNSQNEFW